MHKRFSIAVLICLVGIFFCFQGICIAQEKTQQENKVVRFFKNVINWPFSITKQGAEATGRTAKKGITTVTTTSSNAVETVTGKPEKIKDVIIEPIKGSGETAVTAVEGALKTPIEGTQEAFEEKNN